ncbi:hypothetical protein ACFL4N_04150 [Thermodesulfobacteriota bacterium]
MKLIILLLGAVLFSDGSTMGKDYLDPGRTNIRSRTGELKGWLKKDTLQPYRVNVYDKYGTKKGHLEKDTLSPDTWIYRQGQ